MLPDVPAHRGHPVPGGAGLLGAGHWPLGTDAGAPLRQMVDLPDALGPDSVRRAGLAGGDYRHQGPHDRPERVW